VSTTDVGPGADRNTDPGTDEASVDTTENRFTSLRRGAGTVEEARDGEVLEIRRNVLLSGVVAGLAALLGLAYLVRGGSFLGVLAGLVLLAVAVLHLPTLLLGRTPLLVLDRQGVRFRAGLTWRGLPWSDVRQVVVEAGGSPLREGRLVVVPRDGVAAIARGDRLADAQLRWNTFWYGAPLSLPLGLTTLVDSTDLAHDVGALAAGRTEVVTYAEDVPAAPGHAAGHPDPDQVFDPYAVQEPPAELADEVSSDAVPHGWEATEVVDLVVDEPVLPPAVSPLRDLNRPARVEVRLDEPAMPVPYPAEEREALEAAAEEAVTEETGEVFYAFGAGEDEPRPDPVIGTRIRHAREMLDMGIDELSQRTRIRPHVLEAIEEDDFGPCGGDFYARGHLTAVARVLGLTLDPLLEAYDREHAQAPINASRVFEAELSTGLSGGMRSTLGGPRWSLVIGAVLSLALVWGLVRMFAGDPEELAVAPQPGSSAAGLASNRTPITSPKMRTTMVTVTATYAPTHVVVQDRTGKVLWSGDLKLGKHRKVVGLAPFTVAADNAGAVTVTIKGKNLGDLGTAGEAGSKKFE
jgi:cytoskeletal protein RodZ